MLDAMIQISTPLLFSSLPHTLHGLFSKVAKMLTMSPPPLFPLLSRVPYIQDHVSLSEHWTTRWWIRSHQLLCYASSLSLSPFFSPKDSQMPLTTTKCSSLLCINSKCNDEGIMSWSQDDRIQRVWTQTSSKAMDGPCFFLFQPLCHSQEPQQATPSPLYVAFCSVLWQPHLSPVHGSDGSGPSKITSNHSYESFLSSRLHCASSSLTKTSEKTSSWRRSRKPFPLSLWLQT